MNAYLFLMIIIIISAFIIRDRNKFLLISCSAMYILYGLHKATAIGIDSSTSYYVNFLNIARTPYSAFDFKNIGFQCFTKFFNSISDENYQLYIAVIAAFVIISLYHFLKKYSVNPFLSIMWYLGILYYIFMFSALKQSIAMAILLWAFDALLERRLIKYIVIVIIAVLFHGPALILLPAYWLSRIKIGKNYVILLVAALAFTFAFRSQILSLMLNYYESGETMADSPEFIGGKVIYMMLVIAIAIIMRVPDERDHLYCVMLIFAGVALVLQTFCYYNNIFERLADYYYQFSILLIPMIFDHNRNQHSIVDFSPASISFINTLGTAVITIFAVWRFYTYINITAPQYFLPFRFFWQ